MGPASNEETIAYLREQLTEMRGEIVQMASERPAYGAELTLAQRHLEDARMRLGVALAMTRGEDPFAFKQQGE